MSLYLFFCLFSLLLCLSLALFCSVSHTLFFALSLSVCLCLSDFWMSVRLQHIATHCNTLQHAATHRHFDVCSSVCVYACVCVFMCVSLSLSHFLSIPFSLSLPLSPPPPLPPPPLSPRFAKPPLQWSIYAPRSCELEILVLNSLIVYYQTFQGFARQPSPQGATNQPCFA